jgi:hypothetical protein
LGTEKEYLGEKISRRNIKTVYLGEMCMNNTLFRKASMDRISSPEHLDAYIKVSNPGIWVILAALCALLITVFVWSMTGSLPTRVSVPGVMKGGQAVCYLNTEDAAKVKTGQTVTVQAAGQSGTFNGKVSDVGSTPLSSSEVSAELRSDYLSNTLATAKYSIRVTVAVPQTGHCRRHCFNT